MCESAFHPPMYCLYSSVNSDINHIFNALLYFGHKITVCISLFNVVSSNYRELDKVKQLSV